MVAVPTSVSRPGAPHRDPAARARLAAAARAVTPTVLARDRSLAVPDPLAVVLPSGRVQRGTVVTVAGDAGAGATTLALALVAAATGVGEWAAVVDPEQTLGGLAMAEAGADPERVAVVRGVDRDRWAPVVSALLDGTTVVVAPVPAGLRAADARRLEARARERGAVLVGLERPARAVWPVGARIRLEAGAGTWGWGSAPGSPLSGRDLRVEVAGERRVAGGRRVAGEGREARGGLAVAG